MLAALGALLKIPDVFPYFPQPSDPTQKIYVLFDVCHMLKLVRDTFADKGVLKDGEGQCISWQFLVDLHKVQEKEGLRLGNKIRAAHICWEKQKMKVNLAAQVLSSSVADALEYCAKHLKLCQFEGYMPTVSVYPHFRPPLLYLQLKKSIGEGFQVSTTKIQPTALGSIP